MTDRADNAAKSTVVQFRSAPARVPKGTRLNDVYEIDEQIAAGGMGEVYRGHIVASGEPVAIKLVKPEFAENESMMTLFRKEAAALFTLNHDSIVRYYLFAVDPKVGRPYMAMEYVPGSSLADLLQTRPLTFEEADALRRRLAEGLQVAHDREIVHRDIAPDNVILPDADVRKAKIIDFGIARSTALNARTVIGDGFAGKYNYVSPEQLGIGGGVVTNRSDIYSLGLVLAEALRGEAIDMGGSQVDVVDKRRKLPTLDRIDKRFVPLLTAMLQPDPAKRPASMTEVARWPLETPKAQGGSGGRLVAGLAIALVVALGGGVFAFKDKLFGSGGTTPAAVDGPQGDARLIADYVRYYFGDPCIYVAPGKVTESSAEVDAYAATPEAVDAFSKDFHLVNGFGPTIADARLDPKQCDAVKFLQRADPNPASGFAFSPKVVSVAHGAAAQAKLVDDAPDAQTRLVAVSENGAIEDLTGLLHKGEGGASIASALDTAGIGEEEERLLLAVQAPKGADVFPASFSKDFLDAVASKAAQQKVALRVAPLYVKFK